MSESVKIGGIGKNPAIDRINQLNATDIKKQAVKRIEQLLLEPELPQAGKYHRAVPIDFDSADWKGSQKNKQIREVNSHGNKRGRSYMSGVRLSPGEDPYHTPAGMAETVKRNTGKKIPVQDNPAGSVFRYAGRTDNHIQPVGQTVTGKTGIYSGARDSAGHQPYQSIREQARMIRIQAGPAGIFAFITGGIREDVYHSMFILSVDEKMLLGSFHLPEGQAESGRKTCMDIMRSIQILNTQKNTEAYKSI